MPCATTIERRDLAHVALHEMAHVLSGCLDYTGDFVELLAELAHYLAKKRAITNT